MKPLNILISNDDGVFAAGIRALAKSAQQRGHNVKVVCPDQERSATGCLLYTSPSPRDRQKSRMPSSA